MTSIQQLRGTALAFGLRWRVLRDVEGGDTSAEVLELIGVGGNSRYGVRLNSVADQRAQAFVGFVQEPVPRGASKAVSAAAWLAARSSAQQTLFVGEIAPSLTWIALINADGVVDAETDVVVATDAAPALADHVLNRVLRDAGMVPVSVIVGEAETVEAISLLRDNAVGYSIASLADVLSGPAPAGARIKLLNGVSRPTWIELAVTAAVFLLGAASWAGWSAYSAKKADEEAQAAAMASAQNALAAHTERERNMDAAVAAELLKDTATPVPSAIIAGCLALAERVGNQVAGWDVREVACDAAGNSRVGWQLARGVGGTVSVLESAVREVLDAGVIQGDRPDQAVTQVKGVAAETLAPRAGLTRQQLPRSGPFALVANATLQEFAFANGGRNGLTPAATKSIRFKDPTISDKSKQWQEVPPERSYKAGTATMNGDQLYQLNLAGSLFDAPVYSVKTIKVRPSADGRFPWTVEVIYVVSNS